MHLAGTAYRLKPDSEEKLFNVEKWSTEQLTATARKYNAMLNRKQLVKTLRDRGESLRTRLHSVELELARRKETPHTLSPDQLTVDSFEWLHSRKMDSTWTSSSLPDNATLRLDSNLPVTRQMLHKCSLSERHTRFRTNQSAPTVSGGGGGGGGSQLPRAPGPSGPLAPTGSTVQRWADSALATPGGLQARTCLLDIDESLQLLNRHNQQVQDERIERLSSRLCEMNVAGKSGSIATTYGRNSCVTSQEVSSDTETAASGEEDT